MKEENFGFLKALRTNLKSPVLLAWWVLAAIIIATIVAAAFFLPLILVVVAAIVFGGVLIFVTYGLVRLAYVSARLRFDQKELVSLIQNSKDGILVYDPSFKILEINQAAEQILALRGTDVVGRIINPATTKIPELKIITQVVFPSLAPAVSQISEGGWPQIVDLNLENPDLKLRTVLSRLEGENGKILGFLKIIRDETREAQMIASKNEFITTAAHQLRTPLTAIRWTFETLSQQKSSPETQNLNNDGLKLAERSLDIINNLLDAAKIEEGKFGYRFEEINLNDSIAQIIDQAKTLAEAYGIKLYFSADKNYTVKADQEKLGMALVNLIDNAVKYNTKNGSVAITLNSLDQNSVKISIKDTGVGIPSEEIKKLFNKFYRGSNVVQLEPNGSGLGLYIAKNIIENHGGKISVESIVGRGTAFSIILPFVSAETDNKE